MNGMRLGTSGLRKCLATVTAQQRAIPIPNHRPIRTQLPPSYPPYYNRQYFSELSVLPEPTGLLNDNSSAPSTEPTTEKPQPLLLTKTYEELYQLRNTPGSLQRTSELIELLVKDKENEIDSQHYELMITALADTAGSAEALEALFAEMKAQKMQIRPDIYHSALTVLAVHPNYLLRNAILDDMREAWVDVTPQDLRNEAIGLLRDGQYEMAFDKLESLYSQRIEIESWVLDIFLFIYSQKGFLDEALRILHWRLEPGHPSVSQNILYHLLDHFGAAYHYDGTKYLWGRITKTEGLPPPDGIVLSVLNTASRHADSALALEALQTLAERATPLGQHHFEALVDCYVANLEIESALRTLCIMERVGAAPSRSSTRSLYLCLVEHPALVTVALDALSQLRHKYDLPIDALNVLVEASSHAGDITTSLRVYRDFTRLYPRGPDELTFRHLIEKADDSTTLSFLAGELTALLPSAILPPNLNSKLTLHCAIQSRVDLSLKFAHLAVSQDTTVPGIRHALRTLVNLLIKEKDSRLWDLVTTIRSHDPEMALELDRLVHSAWEKEEMKESNDVI